MAEYIIKGAPGAEGHDGRALAATERKVAEYINREALAMSVLGLTIVDPMVANYADAVLFQIQHAPAADVVEVVRCRDCIYREFDNGCPLKESGYFKNGKMLPLDNDFCSYGERKEDG